MGAWEYRVRACNAAGCGPYSGGVGVQVLLPPAASSTTSSVKMQTDRSPIKIACSVRWTPVAQADRYELTAYSNGQLYQNQYNGPNTSVATSINQMSSAYCAPAHVVRACNAAGCSPWSDPVTQRLEIIEGGVPVRGVSHEQE